ncbi:vWA domain-containing protein [Ancylobacter pratisalsi]|uniref:VWA domain-containing protein n=1 Tax=Ancylobacter pratisalsi TaxID=1745854 RepID=A0A6P1YNJ0_9HYPH|nr:VWA domain-containing protein [Ancylobacter pratisalsi]
MRSLFTGLLAALFLSSGTAHAEAPRTIIVMDGSGSMWGQIDGRAKLEIARETVAKVLGTLPPDQELGLMAYGHRTKGDCSDIELIVPPAKGTAGVIGEKVYSMRFLGKTPLSAAVRQAAEALRYGEEAATVVLVTDGLETCNADPCALGRELEAAGLDFTAHVIGFGLTKEEGTKVACLAKNTGGRYIEASNANALRDALASTVTAQSPPPAPKPAMPSATLSAPDSAPAGSVLAVGFTATKNAFDYVYLLDTKGERVAEAAVGEQNPLSLRLPFEPGSYELVYSNRSAGIIARRPLAVTKAEVMLKAPESAPAGSLIEIDWTGPAAEHDSIQLLDATGERVADVAVSDGNPATLRLPFTQGRFTLVYSFNNQDPIFSRPISLSEGKVTMTAPGRAQVGSEVTITWVGPDAPYDNIQLVRQSDGERISYDYVKAGIPLTFRMPDDPGLYEFLYVFGDRDTIARRPITVVLEKVEAAPTAEPTEVATAGASAPQDGTLLTPQDLTPITVQADTGTMELNIVWSAVPAPGQHLPPEAWAMNEGTPDPVEAEFFPGVYDVRGDAGDTVFAGRITVVAGGANHFVIPYSPALSPAGEDSPRAADGLVTLQLTGVPANGAIRWSAYPIGGQNTLAVGSTDPVRGTWETRVDAGMWLIIGRQTTGATVSHMTLKKLSPSPNPQQIAVGPPAYTARAATEINGLESACDSPDPCLYRDAATGLNLLLPSGWGMEPPLVMETAAGVAARYASTIFLPLRPNRNETMIALNARQWDAMLGPCDNISIGVLCRTEPMSEPDLQAYRILAATLDVSPPEAPARAPNSTATAEGGMPAAMIKAIGGIEVKRPDGFDPLEILAPQLSVTE